jgi:hypothetical protein
MCAISTGIVNGGEVQVSHVGQAGKSRRRVVGSWEACRLMVGCCSSPGWRWCIRTVVQMDVLEQSQCGS